MKKTLRLVLATIVALTSLATQAQLKFCGTEVSAGVTYTSSDFTQIKSGSFNLNSSGILLTIDNLVVEHNGQIFSLSGTNDITVKFIGESSIKRTGLATSEFFFNTPDADTRNIIITGGKLTINNTYGTGAAFAFFKNANILFDDCNISATISGNNPTKDVYSFVRCANQTKSATSRVEIKNSTIVGHTFRDIDQLILNGSNFVFPKSYAYLDYYNDAGTLKYLVSDGVQVTDFTIMPSQNFDDGDVNHDGSVNGADVTYLYNILLN